MLAVLGVNHASSPAQTGESGLTTVSILKMWQFIVLVLVPLVRTAALLTVSFCICCWSRRQCTQWVSVLSVRTEILESILQWLSANIHFPRLLLYRKWFLVESGMRYSLLPGWSCFHYCQKLQHYKKPIVVLAHYLVITVAWLSFPCRFKECSGCKLFSGRPVKFTQLPCKFSQSWYFISLPLYNHCILSYKHKKDIYSHARTLLPMLIQNIWWILLMYQLWLNLHCTWAKFTSLLLLNILQPLVHCILWISMGRIVTQL